MTERPRLARSARGRAAPYVIVLCALLIAGSWAGVLRLAAVERDQEVRRVHAENAFIASAFEEHARRILRTADSALRFMVHDLDGTGPVPEPVREFAAMTMNDLGAVQISVADARGALIYSAVPMSGAIQIADRDHFQVHARSATAGLFVGRPVMARSTGTWSFFLSRRVARRDGSFGGVVSIGLDPFYFGKVYGNLRIGQDRAGILVGTDHFVRVRISRDEEFVGDDISAFSPVFREAARRTSGHYEVVPSRDGKARLASYRAMPDYPLIVIVSAVRDEVLAEWRSRARTQLVAATLFTVFVVGFGYFLVRAQAMTRRREEEARALQDQLLQSQKMEALGILAGGVAHDFNNMLGVILGHVDFAMEEAGPDGPLRESLEEIRGAARRSADVTRQLLAFARKQAIAPRVLDLNEGVEAILRMIRRLIGEAIDLRWRPGRDVWPVKLDPSQLDQLLTNLAANARDAMGAGGGRLDVETSTVTLDERSCAGHPGAAPGDYAVLAVTDSGTGIDPALLPSIFDPFFTTKEMGRGTGLGLATVYGIVRQNGGFVDVRSAVGEGSSFRIHLPRARPQERPARADRDAPAAPARGTETILLVEDEVANLRLVRKMLESLGYRVLATHDPADALRIARGEAGPIHLLLTDVVMPGMDGRRLHEALRRDRADLRCLFMSGYPANVIVHQGVLDEGLDYIQKPFTRTALATLLRRILDA